MSGVFKSKSAGELDGKSILTPYPVTTRFERRRALAATLSDTLYAYDFLELFQRGLQRQWAEYSNSMKRRVPVPPLVMKAVELVLESEAITGMPDIDARRLALHPPSPPTLTPIPTRALPSLSHPRLYHRHRAVRPSQTVAVTRLAPRRAASPAPYHHSSPTSSAASLAARRRYRLRGRCHRRVQGSAA
jgi:hypothetical protein